MSEEMIDMNEVWVVTADGPERARVTGYLPGIRTMIIEPIDGVETLDLCDRDDSWFDNYALCLEEYNKQYPPTAISFTVEEVLFHETHVTDNHGHPSPRGFNVVKVPSGVKPGMVFVQDMTKGGSVK